MPEEAVPPESRVQSRFSDLSCCQLQRSRSKLQLNNGAAKSERKKLNILTFFLLPGIQFNLWKDSSITIKIRKHYSSTISFVHDFFFFFKKIVFYIHDKKALFTCCSNNFLAKSNNFLVRRITFKHYSPAEGPGVGGVDMDEGVVCRLHVPSNKLMSSRAISPW